MAKKHRPEGSSPPASDKPTEEGRQQQADTATPRGAATISSSTNSSGSNQTSGKKKQDKGKAKATADPARNPAAGRKPGPSSPRKQGGQSADGSPDAGSSSNTYQALASSDENDEEEGEVSLDNSSPSLMRDIAENLQQNTASSDKGAFAATSGSRGELESFLVSCFKESFRSKTKPDAWVMELALGKSARDPAIAQL
eukprot:g12683.t1